MQIVSIDKVGETIYGCLDDGISYHIFSIDPDCPVEYEESYDRGDYDDYDQFVLSYAQVDPSFCFLEMPVMVGATDKEDLTYGLMLGVWRNVWEGEG
jgi:hypothetical protein